MKNTYVLIDYENVQPEALARLEGEHYHIMVFVGANQPKVSVKFASSLQRMGERACYIQVSGSGMNALDFHIAYYIGQLAAQYPDAYFHIVSKDTGFDPLIEHLKLRKILASRCGSISDLLPIKLESAKTPAARIDEVIQRLKQQGVAKPRTVKSLRNTVNAFFQKKLTEPEIEHIVSDLTNSGVIQINQTKVGYLLPGEGEPVNGSTSP